MIMNGHDLFVAAPIKDMVPEKVVAHGMSYGLSEAGYDIRIKQEIRFIKVHFTGITNPSFYTQTLENGLVDAETYGTFSLASAIEEFQMPTNLLGRVCDKSSWARKGLSVFNTVIEPGWNGFLTLELVYHGNTELIIPAGAPIAQVIFEEVKNPAQYNGKYQFQSSEPTPSKYEGQRPKCN